MLVLALGWLLWLAQARLLLQQPASLLPLLLWGLLGLLVWLQPWPPGSPRAHEAAEAKLLHPLHHALASTAVRPPPQPLWRQPTPAAVASQALQRSPAAGGRCLGPRPAAGPALRTERAPGVTAA